MVAVPRKTNPRDRSDLEIVGYRDALTTIHASHAHMTLGVGLVRNLLRWHDA